MLKFSHYFQAKVPVRYLTSLVAITCMAACSGTSTAAQTLEQEKLRILTCVGGGDDTPARREAQAWRAALLASGDGGKQALKGPLRLAGACIKEAEMSAEGAAGQLCNEKPEQFAKAMRGLGVTLVDGAEAAKKQLLFLKETDKYMFFAVEGVFGTFLDTIPRPGVYSFLCVAGSKKD